MVAEVEAVAESSAEDIAPADPILPQGVEATGGPNQDTFRYFLCIKKNRRLRRLHRWDTCGTKPASCSVQVEGLDCLEGVQYDAACKHCWPRGQKPGVESDADDSSSSSDSTDGSLASG